jgi:hypothetical protein
MTRIEAEADAKELNKVDPKWFCPLIRDTCRRDCINFVGAYVQEIERKSKGMLHDIKDDNFEVNGHICSNAMYIGDLVPSCMGGE